MKRLVLIDGNAILHRAYHALPDTLTLEDGFPINAVYGFAAMLLSIVEKLAPKYLICAFDLPKPTFRDKLYEGYRAQRPETPEKLVAQIGNVKDIVRAFEIPICEVEGYEADDVIGTLAAQASEKQSDNTTIEIVIVTGDKDLLQLVNKSVKCYMPVKGLSEAKLYGENEVEKKYGIKPEQMVDYKALVGDPSDNYPGVKGIGPKTAVKLIKRLNTIEDLYEEIDKKHPRSRVSLVKKKVVDALEKYKEDALMAKKLAEIRTDVPVELDLKKAKLGDLANKDVEKLFGRLRFKTLWRRVKKVQAGISLKRKLEEKKNKETKQINFLEM